MDNQEHLDRLFQVFREWQGFRGLQGLQEVMVHRVNQGSLAQLDHSAVQEQWVSQVIQVH